MLLDSPERRVKQGTKARLAHKEKQVLRDLLEVKATRERRVSKASKVTKGKRGHRARRVFKVR